MAKVNIRKAYYLCSCTKEHLTNDIPKKCTAHLDSKDGLPLSRVTSFVAERIVSGNRILYPECGLIF